MHSYATEEMVKRVQDARRTRPELQLFAVIQPALVPELRRWLKSGAVNVLEGTRDQDLLDHAAWVVASPDEWLLGGGCVCAKALHRAAVFWCLSPETEAVIAKTLYASAQVQDVDGVAYMMRLWDGMLLRHLPQVLEPACWLRMSSVMPLMLLPDAEGKWLLSQAFVPEDTVQHGVGPSPSALRLNDVQMSRFMEIAENGQAVGFVRERMPEQAARWDEYTLHQWAMSSRELARKAGYWSPADAQVLLAAQLELDVLGREAELLARLQDGGARGRPLIEVIAE